MRTADQRRDHFGAGYLVPGPVVVRHVDREATGPPHPGPTQPVRDDRSRRPSTVGTVEVDAGTGQPAVDVDGVVQQLITLPLLGRGQAVHLRERIRLQDDNGGTGTDSRCHLPGERPVGGSVGFSPGGEPGTDITVRNRIDHEDRCGTSSFRLRATRRHLSLNTVTQPVPH